MSRVLIVEDEGIIAKDIAVTLERMGHDVIGTCATGEEAIVLARDGAPDLVLMDINLAGGMDGTETAAAIRADREVAIVYLTAYADDATFEKAQRARPYGYLVKPYEEQTLRTTLETALRRIQDEREALRRFRALEQLIDETHDALVLVDVDAQRIRPNRAAVALLGDVDPMSELWRPDEEIRTFHTDGKHLTAVFRPLGPPSMWVARIDEAGKEHLEERADRAARGLAERARELI